MTANRESDGYPGSDFYDYESDPDFFDDEDRQPQSAPRAVRTLPSGRHQAQAPARRSARPARPAKRPPAVRQTVHVPDPSEIPVRQNGKRRRRISKRRMRRRIVALAVAVCAVLAVFIATKITVSRVKDFAVTSVTTNQQVLSWKQSKEADGYRIYDGSGNLVQELSSGEDVMCTMDGLKSSTKYTYTIVAVKNFLGKHASKGTECCAYTLPEAVSTLNVINSGTGALLSWDANGASGYEVQYSDGYNPATTLEAKSPDAGGFSVPDLQEGSQYTFQVRSFVQDGDTRTYSEWSASAPLTAVHAADMTGVDVNKPMVALTFDDGPDYVDYTERILDILKEYGGHASFFQEGASAADLPEKITRIVQEGHQIACHTYDHSHYGTDVTVDDIIKADDLIEQACGQRPTAFRSPGGMTTDLIREVCTSENMPIFYWSIDTEDWKSRDADSVCDIVMNNVSDGDIILMHNVYESTVEAVERIVPFLVDKGYQLVTVSQLVQAKTGKPPVPGTQYVTATETN